MAKLFRPPTRELVRGLFEPALGLGTGSGSIWRGAATGLKAIVNQFDTSNAWAATNRIGLYSAIGFMVSQPVFPTFYTTGTPIKDTDLPLAFFVRAALEVTFQNALTGLSTAVRFPYYFDGNRTGRYDGPGTNPLGYIKADAMTIPAIYNITATTKFGFITTIENQLGVSSPSGTLPVFLNSSSFLNRYEGSIANNSGGANPGVSFIGDDSVMNRTAFDAYSASQSGSSSCNYGPCMLLIPYPAAAKAIAAAGNSRDYGVGEGVTGSDTYGDGLGEARRVAGMAQRVIDRFGYNVAIDISRGSDGAKYTYDAANTIYRDQLLVLANPTHVVEDDGHNDMLGAIAPIATAAWAATTVVVKYASRSVGGGAYWMCIVPGTTGTVAPTGTADFTESTGVVWRYIGPRLNGSTSDKWASAYCARAARRARFRALVPGIKIIGQACYPDARSTRSVSSLTSSGTTATAVVASTADLTTGDTIVIIGATPSGYNLTASIVVLDSTSFTYTLAGSLSSPATGTILCSNRYLSIAGQTPNTNFEPAPSVRSLMHAKDMGVQDTLYGLDGRFSTQWGLEQGYAGTVASETGVFQVDGTPWGRIWDGTHLNSRGAYLGAQSVPADPFA